MNFDFSDEQKQFQDQVRRALTASCPLGEVRRCLDHGADYARSAWKILADLGVPGAAISENYGGGGFSYLELCLAAEEIGYALAPLPLASSIYMAAETLLLAGSAAQKKHWLPALATGGKIATVSVDTWGSSAPRVAGDKIYGAYLMPDGLFADMAIVPAGSLYLVDLSQDAVKRIPRQTLDASKPITEIQFNGADAEVLDTPHNAVDVLTAVRQRAAVLLAFEQLGGAARALETARNYALERKTFGRIIGSYQAVKHKLADMYINNQLARVHAYYGAWALANNAPDLPRAAAAARVAATKAFLFAAQENLQVHGGIGFTWEADCQLFYKRARHTALILGSLPQWQERLVRTLAA